jgi:hypothetical protein
MTVNLIELYQDNTDFKEWLQRVAIWFTEETEEFAPDVLEEIEEIYQTEVIKLYLEDKRAGERLDNKDYLEFMDGFEHRLIDFFNKIL